MLMESVGSGIQTEHRGDGLCLLQDVWGPNGEDSMAGSWDRLESPSLPCLVTDSGYQLGPTKAPTLGFSTWPGLAHSLAASG